MALKVRALAKFPARVLGSGPITVSKANGIWTFGINTALLGAIASIPEADRDNVYALMYNSDTGTHSRVSMTTLFTMLGEGFDPLSLTAGAAINWDDQLILYHGVNDGVFPDGRLGINTDTPDTQLHVTEAAGDTTHDTRICISNSTGTQRAGLLISNNTRHIDLLMGVPGATMLGNRWGVGLSGSATYPIIGEHDAGGGASTDGNIGIKASTAAAETIIHPLQVGVAETPAMTAANGAMFGVYRDGNCFGIFRRKDLNMEGVYGADGSGAFMGCSTAGQITFVISSSATAVLNATHFMPGTDGSKTLGRAADLRFAGVALTQTGTIDWGNADVVLTGGADTLTLTGGALVLATTPLAATSGGTGGTAQVAQLGVKITGVNFNSANTDNAITIPLPAGFTRYRPNALIISGASAALNTATCGFFTAAAAGGTALVTNPTAVTVTTAADETNNNMQTISILNVNTLSITDTSLFFRVITPQGSAATGNVTVLFQPIS